MIKHFVAYKVYYKWLILERGGGGCGCFGTCLYVGAADFIIEFQGPPLHWHDKIKKYDSILLKQKIFCFNLNMADKSSKTANY